MNAANPAAWAAFATEQFVFRDQNAPGTGFRFGGADYPAVELITGKRRNVVPGGKHFSVTKQYLADISGGIMDGSIGNSCHSAIIPSPAGEL